MLPISFTSRLLKRTKDAATLSDVLLFINDYSEIYELNAEQLKEAVNKAKRIYLHRLWLNYCKMYEYSPNVDVCDVKTVYATADKKKGVISFYMGINWDVLPPILFKDFEGYNVQVSLLSDVKGFGVTVSYDFER